MFANYTHLMTTTTNPATATGDMSPHLPSLIESKMTARKTEKAKTTNKTKKTERPKKAIQKSRQEARQGARDAANKSAKAAKKTAEKTAKQRHEDWLATGHIRFDSSDEGEDENEQMEEPADFELPNLLQLTHVWVTDRRRGVCQLDAYGNIKTNANGEIKMSPWFPFLAHWREHKLKNETKMSSQALAAFVGQQYRWMQKEYPTEFQKFQQHIKDHIMAAIDADDNWKPELGIKATKKAQADVKMQDAQPETNEFHEDDDDDDVIWVSGEEFKRLKQRKAEVEMKDPQADVDMQDAHADRPVVAGKRMPEMQAPPNAVSPDEGHQSSSSLSDSDSDSEPESD